MRRHVTIVAFLAALSIAVAPIVHGQLIFEETFGTPSGGTSDSLPAGWTAINVDGLTPDASVAFVDEAWIVREDFTTDPADAVAFSTSYYSPPGTSDDWAITPQINLTAGNVLEWEALAPDAAYPDGYEVRLSTTTPTVAAMTVVLATVPAENAAWTPRSVSLAAYAGQAVYIGFRNNSTDRFILLLDDVRVRQVLAADARITAAYQPSEYTLVPAHQGQPLALGCLVYNAGTGGLTGVDVGVTVYSEGSPVHTDSVAIGALSAGASATATFSAYAPVTEGATTITYAVSHDVVDGNPADDTLSVDGFYVTSDTFARDDGVVTGFLGIGAGEPNSELGNAFDILQPAELTQVVSYFTGAVVTETVSAMVRAMDGVGGTPGTLLATSYPFTPSVDGGQTVIFTFAAAVPLSVGSYYVGLLEDPGHALTLGNTATIFTPGTVWVNWPTSPAGGWANVEVFGAGFAKPFVLRPTLVIDAPPASIFADGFESAGYGAWTTFTP